MTFRLARDLKMPVAELRRRLSVREVNEWFAFYTWEYKHQQRAAKQRGQG